MMQSTLYVVRDRHGLYAVIREGGQRLELQGELVFCVSAKEERDSNVYTDLIEAAKAHKQKIALQEPIQGVDR